MAAQDYIMYFRVAKDYIKYLQGCQGLHYVFAWLHRITLCICRVAKDCTQIMAEIQDVRAATDEVGRSKVCSQSAKSCWKGI